jgi:uncharacterized membrane protein
LDGLAARRRSPADSRALKVSHVPRRRRRLIRRSGRAELDRLVGFTDAVVAISITLLVLGLEVPSGLTNEGLMDALTALGPQFFSFLLSFAVIGGFWMSHHRMFRHVAAADDRLLALNGLFLLTIVLLPFPTAVLGEYMHHPAALVLYALGVGVAGLTFTLLWVHIAYSAALLDDHVDARLRRLLLLRFLSTPAVFLGSLPLALAGLPHLTAAVWVVMPMVIRAVLTRRMPTRPGGNPRDH